MKYYLFVAEHIGRRTATQLVSDVEDKDIVVEAAGMDPVFDNQMCMVISADEAVAKQVRDMVWQANRGASCEMSTITRDDLEEYL